MKVKTSESERRWQNFHVHDGELNNPYWNSWVLYHWKTIFYKITSLYDFNDKIIFVGGCGSGMFEEWLIKKTIFKPKRIISIDISDKMIELAKIRCKGLQNVTFIQGDMEKVQFEDKSFDICIIIDALHHVPNYKKTIKEMKRIGKTLVLSEPNALNPIRRLNELKYKKEGVTETSFYEWQLNKILRSVGYNHIKIINQHFIPSFTPENILWKLVKIESIFSFFLKKISGSLLIIASTF